MPISRTATSCSRPSRRSVSGSPISLFSLPSDRSTLRDRESTVATASLVEVFAIEPVMPTTRGSNRRRQAAASAWSAAMPSPARTTEHPSADAETSPSSSASGTSRVTTSAAAPRATASPRKRCPSVCSPGRATKSMPGSTRRESTAARRTGRAEARSRDPSTIAAIPGPSRESATFASGRGASLTFRGHSRMAAPLGRTGGGRGDRHLAAPGRRGRRRGHGRGERARRG